MSLRNNVSNYFPCIAAVCLIASAALILAIVSLSRASHESVSTPAPTPEPLYDAVDVLCLDDMFVADPNNPTLIMALTFTKEGAPVAEVPLPTLLLNPTGIVEIAAQTSSESDETGAISVFVRSDPAGGQAGAVTLTANLDNDTTESCQFTVVLDIP